MTDALFDHIEEPARDPRRCGTPTQKQLLVLRDGCLCRACGTDYPTPDGLQVAHIAAHSLGGPTEIDNLCLLCPACNNAFSDAYPVLLRDWQSKAHLVVLTNPAGVHTIEACPGAGKTLFVKSLVQRLLRERVIGGVLIVGPTTAICLQWTSPYQKLHVGMFNDKTRYKSADFKGMAMTYAMLASRPTTWRKELDRWEKETGLPILVIFDEVHHLGERASWGEAAEIISDGQPVLNLTGTLWRSAGDRIPNIKYDANGYAQADYSYTMADALVDGGILRRPILHGIDGNARLVDRKTMEIEEYDLGGDLPDSLIGHALRSAFDPGSDVLREMLRRADLAVQQQRARSAYADNAVLVVADDVGHAERVAELIRTTYNENPVVVHSDLPDPELALDEARGGRAKWIVSVRMISEGVDIPRISTVVYATKICTKLFFIQVVGRAIRLRADEQIDAVIVYPAIPQFNAFANEIERMVPDDLKPEEECRECGRPGWTLCPDCRKWPPPPPPEPRYLSLPAEDAGLSQTRIAGNGVAFDGREIEELEKKLIAENASPGLAQEAAPLFKAILKNEGVADRPARSPERRPGGLRKPKSKLDAVDDARKKLTKAVNTVAHLLCQGIDPRHGTEQDLARRAIPIIHSNINNHFGITKAQRDHLTEDELKEAKTLVVNRTFDPKPDWYKRRG